MKKITVLFLFVSCFNFILGCCGAGKYRIFPLGQSEGGIVAVTFDLTRKCDRGTRMFSEYHWQGIVQIAYLQSDTIKVIAVLDTIDFHQTNERDSGINYLVQFYDSMIPYYKSALETAKQMKNFILAELVSYQYHHDSVPIDGIEIRNDTALWINEKRRTNFSLYWGACGYHNKVVEIRKYRVNKKEIQIIHFSCQRYKSLSNKMVQFNQHNFSNIETGLIVNKARWHGGNRDYVISVEK